MQTELITITSKRQATLPVKLCQEIGLQPGDKLMLGRHIIDGNPAWVLQTPASLALPWFGCLSEFAKGKSSDINDVRKSIGKRLGQSK